VAVAVEEEGEARLPRGYRASCRLLPVPVAVVERSIPIRSARTGVGRGDGTHSSRTVNAAASSSRLYLVIVVVVVVVMVLD